MSHEMSRAGQLQKLATFLENQGRAAGGRRLSSDNSNAMVYRRLGYLVAYNRIYEVGYVVTSSQVKGIDQDSLLVTYWFALFLREVRQRSLLGSIQ
jgi:hypothetical protein